MSRMVKRWSGWLLLAAVLAAFAALALDFAYVDAVSEPPRAVTCSGRVLNCERVGDGLLLEVEGGDDLVVDFAGLPEGAAIGYRVLSLGGTVLAEGEGPFIPLQDCPGFSAIELFPLDGSVVAEPFAGVTSVLESRGVSMPHKGSTPRQLSAGIVHNGLMSDEETGNYGFGGRYTVEISISNPTPGFSLFGVTAPGGTIEMDTLPLFEFTAPGHMNACSVSAGGGWYRPGVSGWYKLQVSADDWMQLSIGVGALTASAEWPGNTPGDVVYGYLVAGFCYPVNFTGASVGGPAYTKIKQFEIEPEFTGKPHLVVKPHNVVFSRKMPTNSLPCAVASKVGPEPPEHEYEVRCIEHTNGVSVDGLRAMPQPFDSAWDNANFVGKAEFGLFEDGVLIESDAAIFTVASEKPEQCDCNCNEGTTTDAGCVSFSQRFGRTPWIAGLPTGRLAIDEPSAPPSLWTPSSLVYDHPMCRRVVHVRAANPLDAVILDPFGRGVEYCDGVPAEMSSGLSSGLKINDAGFLVEVLEDRTEITYKPNGDVASIRPPDGGPVAVEDLGIDVLRGSSGAITSVVSRADGRLDVSVASNHSYQVAWTGPNGGFVKSFAFSGDDESVFNLHEYRSEQFQFDTEWNYSDTAQDWTIVRAPGTDATQTKAKEVEYDEDAGAWLATYRTLDPTGGVVRTESSVVDVSGRAAKETEITVGGKTLYSAVRNPSGTVAAEVDERGYEKAYLYDEWNRVTNETSVVKGGLVRSVSCEYSAAPADGGVVDRRPTRRVVSLDGVAVEDVETEYGDGIETVTRRFGEETRVSFREFDGQGRTILSVDEAGRAVWISYSPVESDFSWTETRDDGTWAPTAGFSTQDGHSTRRVTSYDASGNAVEERDFALIDGQWRETAWVTNRYSATHKVVSTSRSDGKTSAADWICTGPVWRLDEDGVATTNTYDAAKRLVASTRYGRFGAVTTTYVYDAAGRVVAETESADGCEARTRTREYDERGRVTSETDEQGRTTTYAYSADDLVTMVTNPDGGTRVMTLNADGSLASVTGTAVTPEYHTYGVTTNGLEWTKINYLSPDGARWVKTYTDGFGDVVREERPGANGSTLVTERTYNAKGQLVLTTTTGEPTETREYDEWGDVAAVTLAADGESRTVETESANAMRGGEVWRVSSRAVSCSDGTIAPLVTTNMTQVSGLSLLNETRRVAIDARGNASETWTEFAPATSTRLTHSTSPAATNVALTEEVDGVVVRSVSLSAVTNTVTCDAYRRTVSRTDGRGNATTNVYDSAGRVASVTDAAGATTSYAYDVAGRLAAVTNALGVATVYEYDLKGNKTYEGGGTYPVTYAYDAYNVMTNMTTYRAEGTQSGDTTSWTYNEATGLLLSKTYADGYGPAYTYTDSGNLATRTWARGVVTTYVYDGWNNLTNTAYSDGTRPMAFDYDAMGRQIYAKDEGGVTTTAYDAAGDVVTEYTTGRLYTRTLLRHRDTFGRETGYSLNNSRKTVVEYETDTGRTKRMQSLGAWFTYYYLPGTDLKSRLQYGGSGSAYYTYEPNRDLLTQVRNHINGGVISQYDYVNDAIGRRTEISRSGSMMSETRLDAYGYNDRNELTNAVKNATLNEYAYQYDDIGNRLSSLDLGTNRTYVANSLNQYVNIAEGVNDFTPQFDLDGNQTLVRTTTGDWSVTYNAENRPVNWSCGDKNIEMLFDRMGRRVECVETVSGVTNAHHRFVYDGYLCVQRLNALSGNAIDLAFAWDPTEPVATRPITMQRQGGWNFFYTHDGNKNVSELVFFQQANGIAAHYEYAPFGAVTAATRNTNITAFDVRSLNPYRFSSEYADDALGLVYYNYRHYEPVTGRWLSRDLIGDGVLLNVYVALRNNGDFDFLGLMVFSPSINPIPKLLLRRPTPTIYTKPSVFAHFGSDVPIFRQETYFENRYPGFLQLGREYFEATINANINCKDTILKSSGVIKPFPYEAGIVDWPWENASGAPACGDNPQSFFERCFTLGNYSLSIESPVTILYYSMCWGGKRQYVWWTTMAILDDLGFKESDGMAYTLLGWMAQHRRVRLAQWTLYGGGECDCCLWE